MKRYIVTTICLLLFIPIAQADGPPVREDGTITAKHISFKIDAAQIRETEQTHIIRLTANQHAVLKNYYSKFPKTLVVVTPHYNDCTCDLIYLIWNKTDSIVLSLDSIEYFKVLLDNKEYPYDYQDLLKSWIKQKIIIDTKGNFYIEGKSLSGEGLDNLFRMIAKENDESSRWIAISLPPYLKTEYESKVTSAIKEIKTVAEKYKVKAQIGG